MRLRAGFVKLSKQQIVAPVDGDDGSAFAGAMPGKSRANAAAGSGHQNDGIVEPVGDRDCHAGIASLCDAAKAARYAACAAPRDIGWIAAM